MELPPRIPQLPSRGISMEILQKMVDSPNRGISTGINGVLRYVGQLSNRHTIRNNVMPLGNNYQLSVLYIFYNQFICYFIS